MKQVIFQIDSVIGLLGSTLITMHSLSLYVDIQIPGFTQDLYERSEGDGSVEMCVSLSQANIERPIVLNFMTAGGTAQGQLYCIV